MAPYLRSPSEHSASAAIVVIITVISRQVYSSGKRRGR